MTTTDQQKAYELKQAGKTYAQIGEIMNRNRDAIRSLVRRATGKKKSMSIANESGSKQAVEAAAKHFGLAVTELRAVISSSRHKITPASKLTIPSLGKTHKMRFGVISDTHIGHCKFKEELFAQAAHDFKDVDAILHPGDHLEGMSGRPGHVYELAQIGYQRQFARAVELYGLFDGKPMYGIDGNHDQWFKAKGDIGVVVGENLAQRVKNYTHLGEWEGDLKINGLWLRLFHANDGTAYANSYKGQQLVNSLTGGEKPHVIFQGHYHKSLYQFTRNVHMFDAGTLCGQTQFMRGKKLAAHIGYWVVTITWNATGVLKVENCFTSGYE
jgi:predicted phosphodiesterase